MNFWRYFWTYEYELPDNVGFRLFGVAHFFWLFSVACLTFLVLYLYDKSSPKGKLLLEKIIGLSMIGWIVILAIYTIGVGYYGMHELPLHLCSICGIMCGIHCIAPKRFFIIGQTLYAIGLPATVLALLFPNWNVYPAISFKTIEGFGFHAGLFIYVVLMLYSGQIVPTRKAGKSVCFFIGAVLFGVYVFDCIFDLNYIFLRWPSMGSPLEVLWYLVGEKWYMFFYVILMMGCIYLMLLLYESSRNLLHRLREKG